MEGTLTIPFTSAAKVANVPTPKGDNVYMFFDSADGNKLKVKKQDGTIVGVTSGGADIIFA